MPTRQQACPPLSSTADFGRPRPAAAEAASERARVAEGRAAELQSEVACLQEQLDRAGAEAARLAAEASTDAEVRSCLRTPRFASCGCTLAAMH